MFAFETVFGGVGSHQDLTLDGAGPPCGHPTSNGCALDGANAGFGPFDTPCSRHGLSDESAQNRNNGGCPSLSCKRPGGCLSRGSGGGSSAFSAESAPVDSNPLTPLVTVRCSAAHHSGLPVRVISCSPAARQRDRIP